MTCAKFATLFCQPHSGATTRLTLYPRPFPALSARTSRFVAPRTARHLFSVPSSGHNELLTTLFVHWPTLSFIH
jgi:hypothetical protein